MAKQRKLKAPAGVSITAREDGAFIRTPSGVVRDATHLVEHLPAYARVTAIKTWLERNASDDFALAITGLPLAAEDADVWRRPAA